MNTTELPTAILAREGAESQYAGDVTAEALRAFFVAAGRLWGTHFWTTFSEQIVLRYTVEDFAISDAPFALNREKGREPSLTMMAVFAGECDHNHGDPHDVHDHDQREISQLNYVPLDNFTPQEREELLSCDLPLVDDRLVPKLTVLGHEFRRVATNVQHVTQMETLALAICQWGPGVSQAELDTIARGRKDLDYDLAVKAREGIYEVRLSMSSAKPAGSKRR